MFDLSNYYCIIKHVFKLLTEAYSYTFFHSAVDTVTLSGKSYISYQLKKSFDELFTTLTMQFRTESMETEYLFHAYGKDFFILEVSKIVLFLLFFQLFLCEKIETKRLTFDYYIIMIISQ